MQFRKNSFSYILWALYSIAVLNALCSFAVKTAERLGYGPAYGWLTAALILFVCVDVVLVLCSLHQSDLPFRTPGWLENIGTALTATLLFVFVIFCVITSYVPGFGEDSMYPKWARVGGTVPHFAEGARDWYVQLLHRVYILFGNRSVATYGLQIALELIALTFLFFAIRRLWGNLSALFVLAGWSLLNYGAGTSLQPGHSLLYLFVFGLTLFMISYVCPVRVYSWIAGIFAGILVGLSVYLNALGLLLLIPSLAVFWAREEYENLEPPHPVPFGRRIGSFAAILLAALITFFGLLFADSFLAGETFANVLIAYGKLYFVPGGFTYPDLTSVFPGGTAIPVLILLTLGIPVWFRRSGTDVQSLPAFTAVGILLVKIFGFTVINEVADPVLFTMILALCGSAISGMLNLKSLKKKSDEPEEKKDQKKSKKKDSRKSADNPANESDLSVLTIPDDVKPAGTEVPAEEEKPAELSAEDISAKPEVATAEEVPAEPEAATAEEASAEPEAATAEEPEANTEFLKVPLPRKAPKPHKEMDYDIEVSDDDDYDI